MMHSRERRPPAGARREIAPWLSWSLGTAAGAVLAYTLAAVAGDEGGSQAKAEQLRLFTEVFHAVKASYVELVDDKQLFEGAIRGMVTGLDPDSAYLDRSGLAELQYGNAAVGLELGMEGGLVKVVTAIENTPAFHAGIRGGDLIARIDAADVKGMTLAQAVQRLRGKPGTPVTLSILRPGEVMPLSFTLKRQIIRIQSVKSKWLEPGYAYLRLTQFNEDTGRALAQQLKQLGGQDKLAGLVLDLRNNQGGLFSEAVGVSAAFLPAQAIVLTTDGRSEDAKRTYRADPPDYLRGRRDDYLKDLPAEAKTVPMAILVNGKSAAASEIVSGALQDHRRATVVGTPTFGRSSIQTLLPIPDGSALKLTTARWQTPNGRSVAGRGIVPDIALEEDASGYLQGVPAGDRQLNQALVTLKKLR